jgi:NADPH:quinone reductase-like Zn-dependent oxidoreductase
MKAIVFHQHGGPEVLKYEEVAPSALQRHEVRVAVKAAALNRLDLFVREGWPSLRLAMPHIPGADAAGVVLEVGEEVENVAPGDRVAINPTISCDRCEFCLRGQHNLCVRHSILGEFQRGTYADQVVVPALNVLPLPDHVSFAEAAAFSLVGVTAWQMLITRGHLVPGEDVVIIGAGGGVNTAALQIAKLAGTRVIVVGSDAAKLAQAEALGADVLIDRSREDWSRAIYQLTARRGVDVVVDNVGQATWMGSIRALRPGGRLLVVGSTSGPQFELDIRYVFAKQIGILGSTMGSRDDYDRVMNLLFNGRLKAVIGAEFPLAEARQAQESLAAGDVFGKIVLSVDR